MRAVVQRALSADVSVDGEVVGRLAAPGLAVLLGVAHDDDAAAAEAMAAKLHGLRVLPDEQSVADTGAPVLVVSQFTLYGDTRKGRRPSWSAAASAERAEPLVEAVVEALRARGVEVETGRFRRQMILTVVNDGPLTVLVEVPGRATSAPA